jgi:hypothetical protein
MKEFVRIVNVIEDSVCLKKFPDVRRAAASKFLEHFKLLNFYHRRDVLIEHFVPHSRRIGRGRSAKAAKLTDIASLPATTTV